MKTILRFNPRYFLSTSLIFFFFINGSLKAQKNPTAIQQIKQGKAMRQTAGTLLSGKLHLILAHHQQNAGKKITALVTQAELDLAFDPSIFLFDNGGNIAIRIRTDGRDGVEEKLESSGFKVSGSSPKHKLIEGFIPVERLLILDELKGEGVLSVSTVYKPGTDTGSVDSQADEVLETNRVRATAPNYDGTGISIGVLSDSYDDLGGEAAGIASGDLPAGGATVIQDLGGSGSDEGRAMLELVHDLAPGATLFFATAFGGQVNFANNIQNLADAGCSVIVDDIFYFAEPMFQDGILAQKVDEVTALQDVVYLSSAGNRASRSYESTNINFGADPVFLLNAYDFDTGGPTDFYQEFSLDDGESFSISLQWDDPWFTATGVDTDIDIHILDNPVSTILASSIDNNTSSQEPVEVLTYTNNTGAAATYNLLIELAAGPNPGRVKYVNFGTHNLNEFDTSSPTIKPHAACIECIGVGAAPFYDRRAEGFTSAGPANILFQSDGTPLGATEVRQKPDFTATDGTNNTFFGSDSGNDPDADPNFFGTSAAAPHAAAVAVLIRQANPGFDRDDVYNAMFNSTSDLETAGFDNITGNGLINAYKALYSPGTPAPLPLDENLESGFFAEAWELNFTNGARAQVTGANGPNGGSFHLTLDSWSEGAAPNGLNEAILHFDATNASNIMLSFDQREYGDEDHPMSASFTGSEDSDGVALSVDGINWFELLDLTGGNSTTTYTNQIIDISTAATNAGLTLGADVRIKFQQFDNFPINGVNGTDGMGFDNISITATVLPVVMLSLEVEQVGDEGIRLNWSTQAEINNDYFTVERSINGLDFVPIGELKGGGNTDDLMEYEFLDRNAIPGLNYYRLMQTDFDGKQTHADRIAVHFEIGEHLALFPNPLNTDVLRLSYSATETTNGKVAIMDLRGRIIRRFDLKLNTGSQMHMLNTHSIPAGVYVLQLSVNGKLSHERFVKE